MKVAACFHCEDHLMDDFGGKKLINSFKYFHPEIPIMHFGNREQEIIKEQKPGTEPHGQKSLKKIQQDYCMEELLELVTLMD